MKKSAILIIDDEDYVRNSIIDLLESEGYRALSAVNAPEALKALKHDSVQAIVSDLRMPGQDGLELLKSCRDLAPEVPFILLTGVGTVRDAVSAMKAGAYDFIEKPVDPDQFILLIRRALEHFDLKSEVRYLKHAVQDLRGPLDIIGASTALEKVRALIAQVAPSDATVLITGESGTGKELMAASIHALSKRAEGNFVKVNCAAISEQLFESEFFGHRKGAFTGAISDRAGRFSEAEGGTLVLDEIGTLKPEQQAKLLRILETGEYQVVGESRTRLARVRIIAITNEEIAARVKQGSFRADLFYRLNVFPLIVPPLRERLEDVRPLAEYFYSRAAASQLRRLEPRDRPRLGDPALEVLADYHWPGNVRELRNVIERAVILAGAKAPEPGLFRSILFPSAQAEAPEDPGSLEIRARVDDLEKKLIAVALKRTQGKKRATAQMLGIDPKNLSYYLRKHGLSLGESGGADPDE